jgi:CreA protein
MMKKRTVIIVVVLIVSSLALAQYVGTIGFINYQANFPRPDRVYIEVVDDPKVENVTCYVSRAVLGGVSGIIHLVTQPSRISLSCIKRGPLKLLKPIDETDEGEVVFTESESWAFKELKVVRFVDVKRRIFIYVAITTKLFEGSPYNIISAVQVDEPRIVCTTEQNEVHCVTAAPVVPPTK